MGRTLSKNTIKALDLLDKPHPKYPNRRYTPYEAAQKTGVGLSTIYRHTKQKADAAALAAKQSEGE